MYRFKDETGETIIVLSHVTCVYKTPHKDTFNVYENDNAAYTGIPNSFYDDFVKKLTEYLERNHEL